MAGRNGVDKPGQMAVQVPLLGRSEEQLVYALDLMPQFIIPEPKTMISGCVANRSSPDLVG